MGLIFLIIFIILVLLLEKIMDKLLGVKVKGKISETSGKNINRWGRAIILVIFLCCIPFGINEDGSLSKWYFMLSGTSFLGFQAILEWKYLKDSKQYISTLIFMIIFVVLIYNIEKFIRIIGLKQSM
ncbi:DUF4181 domain-containing protein [Anaerosporobacter sp.]